MTEALRLTSHPVLDVSIEGRKTITITVDGESLNVIEGEILAAALWVNGSISLGHNPNTDCPRGIYCGVGHCYECRVTVDGVEDVRSCLTPVREGMRIFLQRLETKIGNINGDGKS